MNWLVAHLVGDYLLQNDWMAQNKKARSWPCFVHVAIYTLIVAIFTGWPLAILGVVFVTHFIQDRTRLVNFYMAAIGQDRFAEPPMAPWSLIVVDNVLHIVVLYFCSRWATA